MHPGDSRPHLFWQLRTRKLALGQRTLLMAILNLTPDSFSGDGLLGGEERLQGHAPHPLDPGPKALERAVAAAVKAVDAGADIVDLGAESTRPQATPVSSKQEQARILPVLDRLLRERPDAVVSVDTYHAATAQAAARHGAEIINDVSGLQWDPLMPQAVAQSGCGLVLMHTRGRPGEWGSLPKLHSHQVVPLVLEGLCERLAQAEAAGIRSQRMVIDPGLGFGKRGRENFDLLAGLGRLHALGRPLLVGLSRKSFLGEVVHPLQSGAATIREARRIATVAGNVTAILAGAHILRVHDLQDGREAAAVADAVLERRLEPRAAAES
ncbi:MAG: dihydropteroate synthase [Acidobacteriota bacterium]